MRIILSIHASLDANAGAAGAELALAAAYRSAGNEVSVVSYGDLGAFAATKLRELAFPVFCARHFRSRAAEADVIDASSGDAWIYSLLSRRRSPLLVTHSHGLEHVLHERLMDDVRRGAQRNSWKYRLYNGSIRLRQVARSLREADLCLLLNHHDRQVAVERLGVASDRCFVVENGVDDSLLGEEPAFESPGQEGSLRIAILGSYIPRKGVAYGAQALNRYLGASPASTASFLGTGCSREHVLKDFDPALHGRIDVIPGYRRGQLRELLVGSHVQMFTSLSEGFPLALGEAMACGLAPVASAIPGVVEVVEHGKNGLLVPPANADAIVAGLSALAADRQLLARLRTAARARALELQWSRVAAFRLSLYETFIRRKRQCSAPARRQRRATPGSNA